MKPVTTLTTLILLLGALLGPERARAQTGSFTIRNLEATATSVPFRVGTGEDDTYIDSGPITIRGTGQGTFDRTGGTARVTWDVTAVAPGLQAQGIRALTLKFVGVAVYDPEREELFVVDVAGVGEDTAEGQSCTKCIQNINIMGKPKGGGQGADWDQRMSGPVEFRSLTADDLSRHQVADMLVQASQAAGLGLGRRAAGIIQRRYAQEPTKELVVFYPETGEAFAFDLEGGATVEFGPR